ncbi:MAG TPA: YHYH domain-containing protein, partial [Spirochaetota bacterium]|nr:YHYH domain-containing protein [Spirochaetota bacterium]
MLARSMALIVFLLFFAVEMTFAHGGRTDSEGGHWDHQKKEYHYHKDGKITVDRAKSARYDELVGKHDSDKETKKEKKKKDKEEKDTDKKIKSKKEKKDKEDKEEKKEKKDKKEKKE